MSRRSLSARGSEIREHWTLRTVPMFASGAVATAGAIIATLGVRAGTRKSHLLEPILRTWARAWLVPAGVRLQVDGQEHVVAGHRYVVVSNHQSNLDPMAHLAGLRLPLRFLAMRELFDLPGMSGALRRIGIIEVDRENPDSGMIMRGVSLALTDGASVLVYPEGQTSHDGGLNQFHIGAFVLAIEHGVPILPITVIGTREVWAPGSNAIHSGLVRLVIHEPIDTQGLNRRAAIGLRDKARSAIATSL
ncbi:MAG: lysophospholipid acyltransferase family protein [Actinomycetota bacterium]|nr:lysophospholipid acyltransferase family protein [Actinomycetota bacterium]